VLHALRQHSPMRTKKTLENCSRGRGNLWPPPRCLPNTKHAYHCWGNLFGSTLSWCCEKPCMLANCMERTSWEANSRWASPEIPPPNFYGTWRFITVFTWASHWTLSWARWIQFTTLTILFKINFEIILPSSPMSSRWSLLCSFSTKSSKY